MLHEIINEPIEVLAAFRKGALDPLIMRWRGRRYQLEHITLRYHERQGAYLTHYFAATNGPNVFTLKYQPEHSRWTLEEVAAS